MANKEFEEQIVPQDFNVDAVSAYMRDVQHHSLLSNEQERVLAQELKMGILAKSLLRKLENKHSPRKVSSSKECQRVLQQVTTLLNKQERDITEQDFKKLGAELAKIKDVSVEAQETVEKYRILLNNLIAKGLKSRQKILEANLRLVVSVARKYIGCGVEFIDLIQEGNVGLMLAINKYDISRGCKFDTYATWWIKHAILRALSNQARLIRIPEHKLQKIRKLLAAQERDNAIGDSDEFERVAEEFKLTVQEAEDLITAPKRVVSLDMPLGDDGDDCLGDVLADTTINDPNETVNNGLVKEALKRALGELSFREKEILVMRYGLADNKIRSLSELSKHLKVSRETIRNIEAKALNILRGSSESKTLQALMGGNV